MASCAANIIKLFNFKQCQMVTCNLQRLTPDLIHVRDYAARRGTRERKMKLLKAKKKAKKPEVKPKKKKEITVVLGPRRSTEQLKSSCVDDVVICKYHKWKVYNFAEAIQCHRETHHPTVYNKPDAYVQAYIELDMTAAKKNRFIDSFTRLVAIPYAFPMEDERSVLVFCKTQELQEEARNAGATLVGDSKLIKEIEKGDVPVTDFNYVLAHPNILPEMVPIRGLVRKLFPNVRTGTLGVNIKDMVARFRNGIKYTANRDENEQDYGWIEVNVGKLDMDDEHLQSNLQAVLRDVYDMRPKRPGPFVTRVMLCSPPSVERFKLDLEALLPEQAEADAGDAEGDAAESEEEEGEEEDERKKNVA